MASDRAPYCLRNAFGPTAGKSVDIETTGLNPWEDRIIEMYMSLVERDSELASVVLQHPDFGAPGHVLMAFLAEDETLELAG
jgi:oligoribonuclease (3'-5' exoribonuclease)